jgi:hypothetical protein
MKLYSGKMGKIHLKSLRRFGFMDRRPSRILCCFYEVLERKSFPPLDREVIVHIKKTLNEALNNFKIPARIFRRVWIPVMGFLAFLILSCPSALEVSRVFYTVIFETNDGSFIAPQQVVANDKAKAPEQPSRNGFIFTGWYDS